MHAIVVPGDFRDEVERATAGQQGGDLAFLDSELEGLPWQREGRELIRDAQSRLRDVVSAAEATPPRVILFTGHRVDAADRATPRFPADDEATAREAILAAVIDARSTDGAPTIGLAGG